jgi:hypothetical protein
LTHNHHRPILFTSESEFFPTGKEESGHEKILSLSCGRSCHVLVQLFCCCRHASGTAAGLITYLLLSIYCQEQYNEKVSIQRVREIRIKIRNEFAQQEDIPVNVNIFKEQINGLASDAKTLTGNY